MIAVILRILIGVIFLASGFEKVIHPYQNFMYVLEAYQIFPEWMEKIVAMTVPWIELLVGAFMVFGLWLEWALKGSLLFFGCFILIVGQALLRKLPIDKCGCFGEAIHILPQHIIVFDSLMVLALFWLIRNFSKTALFSLDRFYSK